ncbi:hypothetical protein JW930_06405 [Candidatus Woesearchaeota archaeon]|nr:hypothetical protein [Candidatus Woesearchaeota archaeon]
MGFLDKLSKKPDKSPFSDSPLPPPPTFKPFKSGVSDSKPNKQMPKPPAPKTDTKSQEIHEQASMAPLSVPVPKQPEQSETQQKVEDSTQKPEQQPYQTLPLPEGLPKDVHEPAVTPPKEPKPIPKSIPPTLSHTEPEHKQITTQPVSKPTGSEFLRKPSAMHELRYNEPSPHLPPASLTTLKKPADNLQHIKFHQPTPHVPSAPNIPKSLPSFPLHAKPSQIKTPTEDVPSPPPNLRSEISPLELGELEEKYLGKSLLPLDEEIEVRKHLKKPLYVRTDDYRRILENFLYIKDTLKESEERIYRLENLKKNADLEYKYYKNSVEDIQRKLIYIDRTIFQS